VSSIVSDPHRDGPVELSIRGLNRFFGDARAVRGFSLDVRRGEIVSLLGPSGCGKTTTLRCVSGLESIDGGSIDIAGRLVSSTAVQIPPHRRQIGLVFQSYALWPHMTVRQNVGYGLKRLRLPKSQIAERTGRILELVGLEKLADRDPSQLSGGQQQRVALARSLVIEPRLLLLDEPLSNLDAGLRERMRTEIRAILKRVGMTALYVTHDQREAIAISDRIVLMNDGRTVQEGEPEFMYTQPASSFAATFLGAANLVELSAVRRRGDGFTGDTELGGPLTAASAATGAANIAVLRPEWIELHARKGVQEGNSWSGRIVDRLYQGEVVEYAIECGSHRLRVSSRDERFAVGDSVVVHIPAHRVHLVPSERMETAQ
jgi:ABC-type Fe3+/spermidine/putrescine transport system ATPase subunit